MRHSTYKIIVFLTASLFVFGCEKILPAKKKAAPPAKEAELPAFIPEGPVVARVGGYVITPGELNEEIESYNNMIPEDKPESKITTRQQKIDYLKNQIVRKILLYQEALSRGIDKKKEIMKNIEKARQELVVIELWQQEASSVDVPSAEIESYYNTYKEELKEPEERRIRVIGTMSEQEARDILIQLLQGGDFEALAREKSKLKSAKDGGDLGFISKGKNPQFDAAAFSDTLEVGKVSNIIRGNDSYYYIVKLEAKKGGKVKTLSEMWDDIKRGLTYLKQQQRIEDLVGRLSSSAKIEINEAEVK